MGVKEGVAPSLLPGQVLARQQLLGQVPAGETGAACPSASRSVILCVGLDCAQGTYPAPWDRVYHGPSPHSTGQNRGIWVKAAGAGAWCG